MLKTTISRRGFLKLSASTTGALALPWALPSLLTATPALAHDTSTDLPQTTVIRFGTPTDVAATWAGTTWAVDAEGTICRYDRAERVWVPDDADEGAEFPAGSHYVLARWGRPSGGSQMLMVLV